MSGQGDRNAGLLAPVDLSVSRQMDPLSVRISAAIELTGIGRTKLYELIGAGDLETIKIGTRTLVVFASLKRLIERGR